MGRDAATRSAPAKPGAAKRPDEPRGTGAGRPSRPPKAAAETPPAKPLPWWRSQWRSSVGIVAALLGIADSIYLTWVHYQPQALVCASNSVINCEKVVTSPQSVFLGIPVPFYGLAFFVGMGVLNLPQLWRTSLWWIPWLRLIGVIAGIGFAFRLIYAELYQVHAICLYCTGAHLLSFVLFVITVTSWDVANANVPPGAARAALTR